MDAAELAAYYMVDTHGWGDSLKGGLPGERDPKGAVEHGLPKPVPPVMGTTGKEMDK